MSVFIYGRGAGKGRGPILGWGKTQDRKVGGVCGRGELKKILVESLRSVVLKQKDRIGRSCYGCC